MRFMMWVCVDEDLAAVTEKSESCPDPWLTGAREQRAWIDGHQLRGVGDATTVWPRDGGVFVSDGPFAETKEQIAGFDVLECADLDEAVEIASKHPVARFGAIELRPVWE